MHLYSSISKRNLVEELRSFHQIIEGDLHKEFADFCLKEKIHGTLYTSVKCGGWKKDKTVMEMANCTLQGQDNSEVLGWSSVYCSFYTRWEFNKDDAQYYPEEAWSSTKPQLNNLRVFDFVAYVLTPNKKRLDRLDPKWKTPSFVGYSDQSKVHSLMDIVSNKNIVNTDVIIDKPA